MMTGDVDYSARSWYDALLSNCNSVVRARCPTREYNEGQSWNVCGSETELPLWQGALKRLATEVICVEALPVTANILKAAASSLGWPMEVVHAAMTARTDPPTLMFPKSLNFGTENLGLSGQGQNWALWKKANRAHNASGSAGLRYPVVHVPTQTVDSLVAHRRRPVEVLLIDAEGHDPDVLMGARRTLSSGSVGYIEFEVSYGGAWKFTSLNMTIAVLDKHGYDCFWAGHKQLYLITGCWNRAYENRGRPFCAVWGNVACAHRNHSQWHRALWKSAGNAMQLGGD